MIAVVVSFRIGRCHLQVDDAAGPRRLHRQQTGRLVGLVRRYTDRAQPRLGPRERRLRLSVVALRLLAIFYGAAASFF
jgi:hypothetical protein